MSAELLSGQRGRPGWEWPRAGITVLGVGNSIMGDDGLGLALLETVRQDVPDPRIGYVDGGIMGMELLPVVQDADRLLVLDAIVGERPGEVVRLDGDQLPRMLACKLSPHQVGLLDVFAAARLLGREPREVEVVGVVPASIDLHLGLSPEVTASLAPAAESARSVLAGWLASPSAGEG